MFGKKHEKKHWLPFAPEGEPVKPPAAAAPYNPLAEAYGPTNEESVELKNYAIYYRDRDLAQCKGDPMIAIIQAYSQAEAELEASRMQNNGFDILTIRSNEAVDFPTSESEFVFPQRRAESREEGEAAYGADMLRRKRSQRRAE